jgi:hypothetical protein
MPRVPYEPVPTVDPIGGGTPKFAPSVPAGAFGADVAQSKIQQGQVFEKIGDEISKRALAMQELANQTEAKEAESKYILRAGELRAEYSSLQGKAAVDGYKGYQESLKREREAIRNSLKNDASRRLFDGPSMNTMSYTIYNGASHAAQENRKWAVGAATARIEASRTETLSNPKDDLVFQRNIEKNSQDIDQIADLGGWDPDKTTQTKNESVSDLWYRRILATARDEPFKAEKMFSNARETGQLRGEDIDKAEKAVKQSMYQVGSRLIAQQVEEADPGRKASLQQRLDHAETLVKKTAPDDPIFKDYVEQRVHADWNRRLQAKRDHDWNIKQTITAAAIGGKTGALPTTVEELTADPAVEQAWRDSDPSAQKYWLGVLAKNAKGDTGWTEEKFREFQRLKGMSATDPAAFLDEDVIDRGLPFSARDQLANLQRKMKDKAEGDPRVTKALQILGPDLVPAGVTRQNPVLYQQYAGALQDALTDFSKENKRAPKAEEVQTIGRRLLQEQYTGRPGYINQMTFGLIPTGEKTRVFETPAPEKAQEEIRARAKERHPDLTLTDEQVQRIYVREQFRKFYGGSPSAAKPTGGPTVPTSR